MKHDPIVTARKAAFQVDTIDTSAAFAKLRDDWQALERRDPQSSVFLSWDWMAQAFRDALYRWSVLVVRDAGMPHQVRCILPLKYRVHRSRSRQEFQTELQAGGRLLWSEYTGFLCDPEHEQAALQAAADGLVKLPWVKLSMRYIGQQDRARMFTEALAKRDFSVRFRPYMINGGQTNNLMCPQVDLPQEMETFLRTKVSRNERQQFNRFKRRYLDSGEYTLTTSDAVTFDTDLDDLLTLWKAKWGVQKGDEQAERVAGNYRDVLTAAQRTGCLYMPVLRKGSTILGALGHVLDLKNRIAHFIVAGRDEAAEEPFIGAALHFHSIEWAIAQGYGCYDFCHGDEAYKYSYGAQNRELLYFEARRNALSAETVFDTLSTGEALRRVEKYLGAGKTDIAAQACAQLARLFT